MFRSYGHDHREVSANRVLHPSEAAVTDTEEMLSSSRGDTIVLARVMGSGGDVRRV